MGRRAEAVGATAVALLAVVLVGAVVGEFDPAVDLFVALLGLAFLAGALLSIVEIAQRVHQIARFALADVRDGADIAALSPGSHWLRVEADVDARGDTVAGVVDDEPAVAVTVEGAVRERFAGLPWPSARTGTRFERTDAVPVALDRSIADVTLAATGERRRVGHDVRVVGGDRETLTAGDDASTRVRSALAESGVHLEDEVFDGRIFEHYVRLDEATVPDGSTVRLFGPVEVDADGRGTTLAPAGRFASRPMLTTAGWGAILRRAGHRIAVLAVIAPLVGAIGALLLWAAVPPLLG